jgi:hypothetical protein
VSLCFFLVFACGKSLRGLARGDFRPPRVLCGIWLKQWSQGAAGLVCLLQERFVVTRCAVIPESCHFSRWITTAGFEAFEMCRDLVFPGNRRDPDECRELLRLLQNRLGGLPFPVRLF